MPPVFVHLAACPNTIADGGTRRDHSSVGLSAEQTNTPPEYIGTDLTAVQAVCMCVRTSEGVSGCLSSSHWLPPSLPPFLPLPPPPMVSPLLPSHVPAPHGPGISLQHGEALQALEAGTAGGNASSRLSFLSTTLTQLVTDSVSQALFNADRLAFGVHLAHGLLPHLFQATEWDLFLGNALGEWFRGPLPWVGVVPEVYRAMCIYTVMQVHAASASAEQ